MILQKIGLVAAATLLAAGFTHQAPPAQAVTYVAHMTGANQTPPNQLPGKGTATFTLTGTKLSYVITVDGLSGAPTAAHIHVGKAGVSGGPVLPFTILKIGPSGTLASGDIDLTKEVSKGVSGDSLKALFANGNAYVNVHTAANPGGEIRGQILKK
jgi:hypothetical protein